MKKLSTLILMLLIGIGNVLGAVDTQVIQVSTAANPEHVYFMHAQNNDSYFATSNAYASNSPANAAKFAFIQAKDGNNNVIENAYYIYCVDTGKWMSYDKSGSYSAGKGFVKMVGDDPNYFCLEYVTTAASSTKGYRIRPYYSNGNLPNIYLNWYEGASSNTGNSIGLWTDDASADAGSGWAFIEVPKYNHFYRIKSGRSNKYLTNGKTVDTKDNSTLFFYTNNGGLLQVSSAQYMYCSEARANYSLQDTSYPATIEPNTHVAGSVQFKINGQYAYVEDNGNELWGCSWNGNIWTGSWGGSWEGNGYAWYIEEVELLEDENAGKLGYHTVEANNALREALDGDPTQWASAIDAFKASAIVMPEKGKFYRIKSQYNEVNNNSGLYYCSTTVNKGSGNDNVFSLVANTTGDNEIKTIVYYDSQGRIQCYDTKKYNIGTHQAGEANDDAIATFEFKKDDLNNAGCFNLYSTYSSTSHSYLFAWVDYVARNGSVNANCVWRVEDVEMDEYTLQVEGEDVDLSFTEGLRDDSKFFIPHNVILYESNFYLSENSDDYYTVIDINSDDRIITVSVVSKSDYNTLLSNAYSVLDKTGVGYPKASYHDTLVEKYNAADVAESEKSLAKYSDLNEAYTTFINTTDINLPEDGKAYYIINGQCNESNIMEPNKYVLYNNSNNIAAKAYSTTLDESCIWVVREISEGYYALVSATGNGGYLHWTDNTASNKPLVTTYSAADEKNKTIMHIAKIIHDNTNVIPTNEQLFGYLSLRGFRAGRNDGADSPIIFKGEEAAFDATVEDIVSYSYGSSSAQFSTAVQFVEATDYTANQVSLKAPKKTDGKTYSSIYLPYPVKVPEGVTAYYCTLNENSLHLEDIGEKIPAQTGSILIGGTEASTQTLVPATTETASENVSDNVLSGVLTNTTTSTLGSKIYVLNGGQSAGIGFYPYSQTATLTAYKAYYNASAPGARDFYLFGSDDSATGIEGLSEDVDNQNETFDNTQKVLLDGKVVVVRNGKKYSITGQIYK